MAQLVYLISEDWYFRRHFLALAVAAKEAGHNVTVCCRLGEHGATAVSQIQDAGIAVRRIDFQRSSLNPWIDCNTRRQIVRAYSELAPDIVHQIALKPIIHGQYAARRTGVKARVNFLPGFGHAFTSRAVKAQILKPLISVALAHALSGETIGLAVMNVDDRNRLAALAGSDPNAVTVVPGTGVDLSRFAASPENEGPIVATFLGRFLQDKGLEELAEAARILHQRNCPIIVRLVGAPDPGNPASLPESLLTTWQSEGLVEVEPWTDNVPDVWRDSHIAILPSHREGFGMSLAEAAACKRPLVATDVPGCRDAVLNGKTGLLVPPRDPEALANAIGALARDKVRRHAMAVAARQDAETRLSLERINELVLKLYDNLLNTVAEGP